MSERDDQMDQLKLRLANLSDYSVALQRLIEHFCRGQEIPLHVSEKCQHHFQMLEALRCQMKDTSSPPSQQ